MDIRSTAVVVEGQQWQKDLPDLGDIELLVAPWENKAFERELQKQITALPAGLRPDGRVDPFAYYGCVGRTISKTILFDWKNFQDGDAIIPFSRAAALPYLTDQTFRNFRDGVIAAARRVQTGYKESDEAIEKNSVPSSTGAAAGEAIRTA
jgi:hypothetical protein